MTTNFDHIWQRRGTDCLKWDFLDESLKADAEQVLASGVSDSDFAIYAPIIDAVTKRLEHPILGYSERSERYYQSAINWYQKRHNLTLEKEWLHTTEGILPAVAMLVELTTQEQDAVVVQTPIYHGISRVVNNLDRTLVNNQLINDDGYYRIDFDLLEEQLSSGVKAMIFCNPHNPVGRLWTKDEVSRVVELCHRYQVMLISDEVWADYNLYGKSFNSCLATNPDWHQQLAVCTSPTKTFGLTALRLANTIIKNQQLSEQLKRKLSAYGMDVFSCLSVQASIAAFEQGEAWLDEMLSYLEANMDCAADYLSTHLPKIKFQKPEASYLVWLDCRELGLPQQQLMEKLVQEQKLLVNSGENFGEAGQGFIRLNLSCPRSILEQKLQRIVKAFAS
ncbi:pyridoxal phosphate-dependent aminotransferase [Parashewanella curva]|uniref:cysteine-S-conjugate beta-lyase n=1 Tax=Parashewanella curva TaxID=2338552 RepID=A0A3L8PUE6_9GAMM|nr:MalY/PatB family protein [Parashewanella curva]RLV58924.1 pyridoxal phosphate-dependent aminotransferase [Parashewanella curva]